MWGVLSPRRLDDKFQKVKRICVGATYIAPRSPYKEDTITHIINTIHMIRARYNNEVNFLIAGDYNRVSIHDILLSYGGLQQMCGVPTRKGATLELREGFKKKTIESLTAVKPEGGVGKRVGGHSP